MDNNTPKKRIVAINLGNFGSTGTIAHSIGCLAERLDGAEFILAYPWQERNNPADSHSYVLCKKLGNYIDQKLSYHTGYKGCFSHFATMKFLRMLRKFKPDVIHLHNLHDSYINLSMLFSFIKKHNIKVVWTLHDCWAFTGHCPHFTIAKCDKWKNGCCDCPQHMKYPCAKVDRTKILWKYKKKWFTGVKDLTIVTPSQWLADLVKESFLSEYPVKVINNGINLSVFKPTKSDFREKHGLENKFVVLGVAFAWSYAKGLDVFVQLASRLDEKYQIVLVGTDNSVDKNLPENIISINRTQSQKELAEIYTAADLFVNPTREEVLGLVNVEALACGTPVVTFKTGGSPECIDDTCGCVVDCDDVDSMENEIRRIFEIQALYEAGLYKLLKAF